MAANPKQKLISEAPLFRPSAERDFAMNTGSRTDDLSSEVSHQVVYCPPVRSKKSSDSKPQRRATVERKVILVASYDNSQHKETEARHESWCRSGPPTTGNLDFRVSSGSAWVPLNMRRMPSDNGHTSADCDVAVIGAGPYGLSAAVYLQRAGLRVKIFGEPMAFWAERMPRGMLLRSPRVASSIADPRSALTLDAYEAATGIEPSAPVPLSTFVSYGRWFQQQHESSLVRTPVAQVARSSAEFRLTLKDGVTLTSRRVVVAAGISAFRRQPEAFARLAPHHVSHCYEGRQISDFRGKRVAVVGAGQSALESAALLHEAGAEVEVIARAPKLRWIGQHSWLHGLGPLSSLLYSKHDVGPVGISRLVAYPKVLLRLPLSVRDRVRTRAVRPAGAPWLIERLASVKITTGQTVANAEPSGNEVRLTLHDGSERRVDHVLLGTGYRVDLRRYEFLSPNLLTSVRQCDGSPVLAAGCCSSVPGLHFVGAAAARSFGPLLYFVAGTEFASRELCSHVLRVPLNG